MTKKFDLMEFINQLVACEPRAGKHLAKAERLILKLLRQNGFEYQFQPLSLVKANNLLVGNLANPKSILLTYFDAIGPGALDNASGVAVCLKILIEHQDFIKEN